jgi:hypothetical protein
VNPTKTRELKILATAMVNGNPLEAAFDSTDARLRRTLRRCVAAASVSAQEISVKVSFAFGPTINEIGISANGLHVHVAGPLTVADLRTVRITMPFHAADFAAYHTSLTGPPLTTILPVTAPTLRELAMWDQLLLRRFYQISDSEGRRKWIRRMLRNRRLVPDYWRTHKALISYLEDVVHTAEAPDFDSIIGVLLESVAAVGAASKPPARDSGSLS